MRLERAKGFGVAPGSQPISKKTGIIFHVLTANLSSLLRKRKSLICKVPASDHLLQLAIRPSGRLGKKLQQIQLGQHVVKVFGHLRHRCFESLAPKFKSAEADAL